MLSKSSSISARFPPLILYSIALWDKGLFGLNRGAVNYNDNEPVTPLREMDGLSQAQWFGHGYKGFPPNAGDFMVLPAGGVYTGESLSFTHVVI